MVSKSLFNFFFFFVMLAYLKDIFSRESQFVIKLNKYKTVKVRKDYTHDVVSFELTCWCLAGNVYHVHHLSSLC